MFCAIFGRILQIIQTFARKEKLIDECNKWFEDNHLYIVFHDEKKMKIKVFFVFFLIQ